MMVLEIAHTVAIIMSTKDYLVFLRLHFSWKKFDLFWLRIKAIVLVLYLVLSILSYICITYLNVHMISLHFSSYFFFAVWWWYWWCGVVTIPWFFLLHLQSQKLNENVLNNSIFHSWGLWLTDDTSSPPLYQVNPDRQELRNISTVGGRTTDKDNRREIQCISKKIM